MDNQYVDLLMQLMKQGPNPVSKSGENNKVSGDKVLSQLIQPQKQPSLMDSFQQENNINPWQEGVAKALKKSGEQMTIEAVQQGVPPENIMEQAGIQIKQATNPLSLGSVGVENNRPVVNKPGLIGELIGGTNATTEMLNQAQIIQKLLGQEPMQAGEKEKLGIESKQKLVEEQNKFFDKILSPQPMAGESAKQISLLAGASDALSNIEQVFSIDPEALRNTARPGNPLGQQLKFWTETLANNLLRQESGAAISDAERKWIKTIVTPRGWKAAMEDPKTTSEKLRSLKIRVESGLNLLQPNQQTNSIVKGLLQKGYSREEIYSSLKKRGMI